MAYGDGPPYSEDEDLHSPVVVSSKHRKSKSTWGTFGRGRGRSPARGGTGGESDVMMPANYEGDRGFFTGTNGDGSETYYVNNADDMANGPGGELVTYPPDQARHSTLAPNTYNVSGQRDSHFAATLPNRSYRQRELTEDADPDDADEDDSDDDESQVDYRENQSRYSRDYQFTIASPDEEMHGKAVALFDFARENENELPLVEGQVIWVSYRHGQGWLVAEDPKTGESGLVPEEYVRLLRHIEGGWTSLNGELANPNESGFLSPQSGDPDSAITPTQADPLRQTALGGHSPHPSNGSNAAAGEKHPPMVSTFSTSSKDLHPYPQHLLGTQAGQTPPHVMHYDAKRHGSQMSTPTLANPTADIRRGSGDSGSSRKKESIDAVKDVIAEKGGDENSTTTR